MPTQVTLSETTTFLSQQDDPRAAIKEAQSGTLQPLRITGNQQTQSIVGTPVKQQTTPVATAS